MTVGTPYFQSQTPGSLIAWAELGATDYVTLIGIATTAAILKMTPSTTGIQIPA